MLISLAIAAIGERRPKAAGAINNFWNSFTKIASHYIYIMNIASRFILA